MWKRVALFAVTALLFSTTFPLNTNCAAVQEKSEIPVLSKEQAESLPKESTQGDDIPLVDDEQEQQLDELQASGSQLVAEFATWVDSFFEETRYEAEDNHSRAKIKLEFGYSRFYDFEFQPKLDLRLKLPTLENRANIFLRAGEDNDFDADSNPISNLDKNNGEELTAGIKYFVALGENYNIYTDAGVSFNYVYAGLRYRYLHQLFSSRWNGRFIDRLRYYSDDGWENKASYDLERNLWKRFFLRATLAGVGAERFDGIQSSAVLRLYQVLSIERAILYDVGAYTETEPEFELTDLQFKLRYRQRFYRDWLVLEVAPQVTFPSEYKHEFNPGLVIKLEADFGYLEDRKIYDSVLSF